MNYQVEAIQAFEKAVRALAKKFRNIKRDLEIAVTALEQDPHIGVAIPGYEGAVWKLRVANTSAKRGKQGGFRIIYLIEEQALCCYLLTIYSKTDKSDVTAGEIEDLLQALEQEFFADDPSGSEEAEQPEEEDSQDE